MPVNYIGGSRAKNVGRKPLVHPAFFADHHSSKLKKHTSKPATFNFSFAKQSDSLSHPHPLHDYRDYQVESEGQSEGGKEVMEEVELKPTFERDEVESLSLEEKRNSLLRRGDWSELTSRPTKKSKTLKPSKLGRSITNNVTVIDRDSLPLRSLSVDEYQVESGIEGRQEILEFSSAETVLSQSSSSHYHSNRPSNAIQDRIDSINQHELPISTISTAAFTIYQDVPSNFVQDSEADLQVMTPTNYYQSITTLLGLSPFSKRFFTAIESKEDCFHFQFQADEIEIINKEKIEAVSVNEEKEVLISEKNVVLQDEEQEAKVELPDSVLVNIHIALSHSPQATAPIQNDSALRIIDNLSSEAAPTLEVSLFFESIDPAINPTDGSAAKPASVSPVHSSITSINHSPRSEEFSKVKDEETVQNPFATQTISQSDVIGGERNNSVNLASILFDDDCFDLDD